MEDRWGSNLIQYISIWFESQLWKTNSGNVLIKTGWRKSCWSRSGNSSQEQISWLCQTVFHSFYMFFLEEEKKLKKWQLFCLWASLKRSPSWQQWQIWECMFFERDEVQCLQWRRLENRCFECCGFTLMTEAIQTITQGMYSGMSPSVLGTVKTSSHNSINSWRMYSHLIRVDR